MAVRAPAEAEWRPVQAEEEREAPEAEELAEWVPAGAELRAA